MTEKKDTIGQLSDSQKILRRLKENKYDSVHISRIPPKTREAFIKLAKEEFCDDFGLALKSILEDARDYRRIKPKIFTLLEQMQVKNDDK